MRFAFWNTGNHLINPFIISLSKDYSIDILVLAEYIDNLDQLKAELQFESIISAGCKRISILSSNNTFSTGPRTSHYSINVVNEDFILCCMHLQSRLYDHNGEDRGLVIDQLLTDLDVVKKQYGINNTVFLGDLNENPYDRNLLAADKLHALPCIKDLDKESRTILSHDYIKYYNPMWNLLGDRIGVPGTYYYNSSELTNPFWHMLDQVIISKSMYNRFIFNELKIVTRTNCGSLIDERGLPNTKISDHLPLVFEIGDDCNEGI